MLSRPQTASRRLFIQRNQQRSLAGTPRDWLRPAATARRGYRTAGLTYVCNCRVAVESETEIPSVEDIFRNGRLWTPWRSHQRK
jgi:hypothetical protein